MEQERDQVKADMAAVTDERNKYSQIVADLEVQMVSSGVMKYVNMMLIGIF